MESADKAIEYMRNAISATMQEDWDTADDWQRLAEQEVRRLECMAYDSGKRLTDMAEDLQHANGLLGKLQSPEAKAEAMAWLNNIRRLAGWH